MEEAPKPMMEDELMEMLSEDVEDVPEPAWQDAPPPRPSIAAPAPVTEPAPVPQPEPSAVNVAPLINFPPVLVEPKQPEFTPLTKREGRQGALPEPVDASQTSWYRWCVDQGRPYTECEQEAGEVIATIRASISTIDGTPMEALPMLEQEVLLGERASMMCMLQCFENHFSKRCVRACETG